MLLTSRGRGVAVVQSVAEFEAAEETRAFMRAVVEGLSDLEDGRELSLREGQGATRHRVGMSVRIRFAESALGDLDAVRGWYAGRGVPDVGMRFVAEIIERVQNLANYPDLGRVVPEFGQTFLRELLHPPFRIVYRRESDAVRIVRVWRGERRLRLPDD